MICKPLDKADIFPPQRKGLDCDLNLSSSLSRDLFSEGEATDHLLLGEASVQLYKNKDILHGLSSSPSKGPSQSGFLLQAII